MATHIINGRKIVTEHVLPPIPVRQYDWSALEEDWDLGSIIGRGPTEAAAIADLLEQLEDEA